MASYAGEKGLRALMTFTFDYTYIYLMIECLLVSLLRFSLLLNPRKLMSLWWATEEATL